MTRQTRTRMLIAVALPLMRIVIVMLLEILLAEVVATMLPVESVVLVIISPAIFAPLMSSAADRRVARHGHPARRDHVPHRRACNCLAGAVVVTERGADPAAKGEPGTGVRAPVVALMVYAETSFEPSFAT